jgi:hypothetical protein
MFQKNIEALKNKNIKLAEELRFMTLDKAQENIGVFEAESKDLIISYNDVPLDGIYDPVREAKTIWNKTITKEPSQNDIIVVFGMGLGYLFKRTYINSPSRILLYEPRIEILRFVLEYIDLYNEISDQRVFITSNYDEALEFIGQKYLANDMLEMLYLKSYAIIAREELIKFSGDLLEVCSQRNLDSNTILGQNKIWVENIFNNISYYDEARPVSYLENNFEGKTALIASAGPSLADDVDTIKNNRNKFVIFCVNKAVKTLLDNNIEPDFVVFADSQYIYESLLDAKNRLTNTNLILCSRSDSSIFSLKANSKLMYYLNTDGYSSFLNNVSGGKIKSVQPAGTVSIISYFIAKSLGFSKFIFSGLNLAFKGEKKYASGEYNDMLTSNKTVYVKDTNGNNIPTRADYALFIRQFEEIIKNENSSDRIYNTAYGAYVEGMQYVKLIDLLKDLQEHDLPVNNIVKNMYADSEKDWEIAKNISAELVTSEKSFIEGLKKKVSETVISLEDIDRNIEENNSFEKIKNEMVIQLEASRDLLNSLLNDMFLSQYLQGELLEYARNNKTSAYMEFQDIKQNIKLEIELYKKIETACGELLKTLTVASKENCLT